MSIVRLMNNRKWDETRLGMYELGALSPKWRKRMLRTTTFASGVASGSIIFVRVAMSASSGWKFLPPRWNKPLLLVQYFTEARCQENKLVGSSVSLGTGSPLNIWHRIRRPCRRRG